MCDPYESKQRLTVCIFSMLTQKINFVQDLETLFQGPDSASASTTVVSALIL
jgi:hypothetical protein